MGYKLHTKYIINTLGSYNSVVESSIVARKVVGSTPTSYQKVSLQIQNTLGSYNSVAELPVLAVLVQILLFPQILSFIEKDVVK
jgi:hypothetical protein